MTVKELKEFLKDVLDDAEIYVGEPNHLYHAKIIYEYIKTLEEENPRLIFKIK